MIKIFQKCTLTLTLNHKNTTKYSFNKNLFLALSQKIVGTKYYPAIVYGFLSKEDTKCTSYL